MSRVAPGDLHPRVLAAGAEGRLPPWASLDTQRRAHTERVTALLDAWATRLELPETERVRWRAAGWLHDALKDTHPAELQEWVDDEWPDPLLHGMACAARLAEEGVDDRELLLAIGYHPIGHPSFGRVGDYLYLADFLEPGRKKLATRRARLRDRLPYEPAGVLREVAGLRIGFILDSGLPIMQATVEFWNRLIGEGTG